MELLAVIMGLEALVGEGHEVIIYTDSKYVVDPVERGWVFTWQKKNFKSKKNTDLWKRFLMVYEKHKVHFIWIKGHANNTENERCDKLAVLASEGENLKIDQGYEDIIVNRI